MKINSIQVDRVIMDCKWNEMVEYVELGRDGWRSFALIECIKKYEQ